jgi:hypothetical protein
LFGIPAELLDMVCPFPAIDNLEEFLPAFLKCLGCPSLLFLPAPSFLPGFPLPALYFRLTFASLEGQLAAARRTAPVTLSHRINTYGTNPSVSA